MKPPYEYTLREYQQDAVNGFWNYVRNSEGNPVLVLPTAAGKSIIIADICKGLVAVGYRGLVVCRQKELVQQNLAALNRFCPDVDAGIYCAGLGKKQTDKDIIFGTIQSLSGHADIFGARQLTIIDEAHQVSSNENTQYARFLADLKTYNPKTRTLGLTATPFRLDCGPIVGPNQMFDGTAYEVTVERMLEGGYICPVRTASVSTVDTSNVRRSGWDFNLSELASTFEATVDANADEIIAVANTEDRKKCLCFTTSVKHAEDLAEIIEKKTGERAAVVTGETMPILREAILDNFRNGVLRWLVNCSVLTTGFDAPKTDLIALCRATLSPGLFAQMVGRGLRLAEGKKECLVLDFGGNTRRHGAIDDPDFGVASAKNSSGEPGQAPRKECPACEAVVASGTRYCECGFKFEFESNVDKSADGLTQIMQAGNGPKWYEVTEVEYFIHTPREEFKEQSMRVQYTVEPLDDKSRDGNLSTRRFNEWICLAHEGFPRQNAMRWWMKRSRNAIPSTIFEAVELASRGCLCTPKQIKVKPDGKYHRITDYKLTPKPEFVELEEDDCPF